MSNESCLAAVTQKESCIPKLHLIHPEVNFVYFMNQLNRTQKWITSLKHFEMIQKRD